MDATAQDADPQRPDPVRESLSSTADASAGAWWRRRVDRWRLRAAGSAVSCWLFLRLLGVVYLIAFASLSVQIIGLAGAHGILPAAPFLEAVHQQLGAAGYWLAPTVCWVNASDAALRGVCAAGIGLSVLLILDIAPALTLGLLYAAYLSVATICRDFLWFQWDSLLLEAGFLAIFLAPRRFVPRSAGDPPHSPLMLWLLRWLLFRVMFSSGVVKLASGDPTWRSLTALAFHYYTQPLPTWTSWYAHHWPLWFHRASCVLVFALELLAPWLIFGARRTRRLAFALLCLLQTLIAATGNYGFFNLLTIVLCVLLLDDDVWPRRWRVIGGSLGAGARWPSWLTVPVGAIIGVLSIVPMLGVMREPVRVAPLVAAYRALAPFRLVNSYGLFAVMTTARPEIILEGSRDQREWRAYEFFDKPGDVHRAPRFVAPFQPRLDWQMWFAALGGLEDTRWFLPLCERLLEGSPDVLALLKENPFPDAPPRYLRATVYDYAFTDTATRRADGAWWRRTRRDLYCPVLALPSS